MKRFNISHEYDFDLWKKGVYSANSELLSQICAFLNPIRAKAENSLDMKSELKLSSGYVLFYYLLNISKSVISFAKNNTEKSSVEFLEEEFSRMFCFEDFKKIVKEHALVPISAMTDASHRHKNDCVFVTENRLRLGVYQLCTQAENEEKISEDIYGILCDGLSVPPENFDFTYISSDGSLKSVKAQTPFSFFENYCNTSLDEYCEITQENELKNAVAKQIRNGEQVVVLADTRHQCNQMLGILDSDFIDNTDMFGADYSLSKADKQRLGIINPHAYLSLDGVSFGENGEPVRFKAQDSHGSETGADGHYTMSAKWFDEYVLSAIVNKKYID